MPLSALLHFVYPQLPSPDATVIFDINCQKAVQGVPAGVVYMNRQLMFIHRIAAGEQFFELFPGNFALWIVIIDRVVDSHDEKILYK